VKVTDYYHSDVDAVGRRPNQPLKQTVAAILVPERSLSLSAAAAAELFRSAA